MLKRIDIEDKSLEIFYNRKFKNAHESNSYFALYKGENKGVKLFKEKENIDNKIKKIILLKKRLKKINFVVTADSFITKNNEIIGYMMPYIDGDNVYMKKTLSKQDYINYLKALAKHIKQLHKLNIVLADFHSNTIISNNKIYFIDHDNFAIDELPIDLKNIYLKKYEKHIKQFDKRFDYYLLNLHTIATLKKIYTPYIYPCFKANPREFNFKDKEIYDIFNHTMNLNKFYNEDLIIDKINNVKDLKKIRTRIF